METTIQSMTMESESKKKSKVLIHPTAIVSPGAKLDSGVVVGPYSIIGAQVKIGRDTQIMNHVVIDGRTEIGERCIIYSGACLGSRAQIKKASPVNSKLVIGDDNTIREHVTMNPSMKEGGQTLVGHRNFIMIGAHIAHDCVLGNDITIANGTGLSGHVTVEDLAVIGGMVGIHQFARVGKLSMIGGVSKVVMDVPPFSICDGHPAIFYGLNSVGLRRNGYSSGQALRIKKALKILFRPGAKMASAIEKVKGQFKNDKDIDHIIRFVEHSERGVARLKAGV